MNKYRLHFAFLIGLSALLTGWAGSASAINEIEGTPRLGHVFIIVGENTDLMELNPNNAPYLLGTLKPTSAWLTQYFATTHKSEANYVAMTSGQYTTCQQLDGSPALCHQNVDNLFSQMAHAGISFKTWAESMPAPCYLPKSGSAAALNNYTMTHNPQLFFDNVEGDSLEGKWAKQGSQGGAFCQATNIPTGTTEPNDMLIFHSALAEIPGAPSIAEFNFIIPNKCEDGHDQCNKDRIAQFDDFLAREVPLIQQYIAQHGGLLIVTFDEGSGNFSTPYVEYGQGGNVAWLAWGPQIQPGVYSHGPYTHYSFLRMLQNGFRLTTRYLGNAANVLPVKGIWRH